MHLAMQPLNAISLCANVSFIQEHIYLCAYHDLVNNEKSINKCMKMYDDAFTHARTWAIGQAV